MFSIYLIKSLLTFELSPFPKGSFNVLSLTFLITHDHVKCKVTLYVTEKKYINKFQSFIYTNHEKKM